LLPWGVVEASRHVNLTLWDGAACWEGGMSAHGEITENQFSVNAADLARLTDVFEACVEAATVLD
ncbi:hypothetical protein, partial [Micromonospora orduensis]|uniref:hypothetical protein n=1 Tax=Micromonospora orduensis TaxID=1420891 RepID=UPI00142E965C